MRRVAFLAASLASLALISTACGGEQNRSTAPSTIIGGTTPATTAPTTTTAPATTGGATTGGAAQGDPVAGKTVFTANCGACHTLSDAGTSGAIGPNLDDAKPSYELVVDRVTNGAGAMPAFGKQGTLTEKQIQDVAAYVVQATSG
jgi:mono/diheme cytochrome c family protein